MPNANLFPTKAGTPLHQLSIFLFTIFLYHLFRLKNSFVLLIFIKNISLNYRMEVKTSFQDNAYIFFKIDLMRFFSKNVV